MLDLPTPLTTVFTGVTFTGNSASNAGGALLLTGNWCPRLTLCSFVGNNVSNLSTVTVGENAGGGMFVTGLKKSPLEMSDVYFESNSAFTGGGFEVSLEDRTRLSTGDGLRRGSV